MNALPPTLAQLAGLFEQTRKGGAYGPASPLSEEEFGRRGPGGDILERRYERPAATILFRERGRRARIAGILGALRK